MDNSVETPRSAMSSGDETQRVKFLCSFGGSILPRPQDGKLRYVGGETRIVCVPRDITYEELMGKMRELYEGANVFKYQQPEEDLDALVSVVNDDDVVNMMEEYDKLDTGEGFTRLRIFLFAYPDQDVPLHFGDGDERDNERRYVDALNSLNESPDFKRQLGESLLMGSFDDVRVAEQYFNQMNLEGSQHGQRNMELPIAQMNLRRLTIPHLGSGQLQQTVNQRYNEMETPWSPAYYSPIQPGVVDQRPVVEFPTSPTPHFRPPYGEFADKGYDRMPDDYLRPPYHTPAAYEHQMQYPDNVVMIPTGHAVNEKGGFPGNILQGSSAYEGNSICEHCRVPFPRNPLHPESSWKPGEQSHLEPSLMGNGYLHDPSSCSECYAHREAYVMNPDANLHHPPNHFRDQSDPRSMYSDTPGHERGWISSHYQNPWGEEPRPQAPVSGRLVADSHFMESGLNIPLGHGNDMCDGQRVQSPYIHHEDPRFAHSGVDHGTQVFLDQAAASGSQVHPSYVEERGVRGGNSLFTYGNDHLYQVPYGHIPPQNLWRNFHSPLPGGLSYETSAQSQLVNGPVHLGFAPRVVDSSSKVGLGMENQHTWVVPSQKPASGDGSVTPDSTNFLAKIAPSTSALQNHNTCSMEPIQSKAVIAKPTLSRDSSVRFEHASMVDGSAVAAADSMNNVKSTKAVRVNENNVEQSEDITNSSEARDTCVYGDIDKNSEAIAHSADVLEHAVENGHAVNVGEINANVTGKQSDDLLEFLPELIASKKAATLKSLKEVKAKAQEETDLGCGHNIDAIEDVQDHKDGVEDHVDGEVDSDNDNANPAKIEMTKAEAEAIERGLQTIKNEDLEEIRELGSGTYGSVYHGKWKGSDVAIKRIKASCFAGRPSERERLIADFWREALLLSSLHHPNVVAFYGVVRDGPDGSLATVTEFMINGSLKQFLKKKDRTIDRRKRLIIAMDTAFGMEYLHGKNIVHFDLKCENLMVNMRDPHRPVCKIGDLGLSKVKQHTLVSGGVRGTLPWMAPELLSGKSTMVTEKIDVYSFGIVMWELLTGDEPYADMHCASIIGGIVNNTLRPQTPTWCDPEWKSLMESCWDSDPAQRPSFSEVSQKLRNLAAAMNLK